MLGARTRDRTRGGILALVAFVLAHNLLFLLRYGSSYSAFLERTGHGRPARAGPGCAEPHRRGDHCRVRDRPAAHGTRGSAVPLAPRRPDRADLRRPRALASPCASDRASPAGLDRASPRFDRPSPVLRTGAATACRRLGPQSRTRVAVAPDGLSCAEPSAPPSAAARGQLSTGGLTLCPGYEFSDSPLPCP